MWEDMEWVVDWVMDRVLLVRFSYRRTGLLIDMNWVFVEKDQMLSENSAYREGLGGHSSKPRGRPIMELGPGLQSAGGIMLCNT